MTTDQISNQAKPFFQDFYFCSHLCHRPMIEHIGGQVVNLLRGRCSNVRYGSMYHCTSEYYPTTVLKRTVRFHVSLYFRILSDDRAQTYYRTNLCSASSNFPELSEDHRSRQSTTGIELLAIDTFPRTVNDRCVSSSPKINMLGRERLMRYSVPHLFCHGLLLLGARSRG